MNKKYTEAVKMIKNMPKDTDKCIVQGLFSIANIQESDYIDRRNDLTGGTDYSNLNDAEFMKLFNKNKFNNFKEDKLTHLFQEMHNRYMAQNGYEVTRNVLVAKEPEEPAYGFVNPEDDLLFINKSAIDKAKNVPLSRNLNQNTLGHCMFYVISHESQHVVQLEKILDNAMGKKQNEDDAFLSSLFAIENINFYVDAEKDVTTFTDAWQDNYDFQFVEHNANYSAYQNYKKSVADEDKLEQTGKFITNIALRGENVKTSERIAEMEKFARFEIDYFDKNVKDCAMKKHFMETVNDYMKVDKNGNSKFRDILNREVGELVDLQNAVNKKTTNKEIKEECQMML